ncbi:hypothetical protein NE237_002268 [Protea cynaroides]|uniref:Uncharacterized protein n=1 Tax=Protea cynaroides TaxID=273540 RepID=A0A9Q0KUY0_9MAGN|nr:hypothetical protein NE237_002268 [Protea cynaroides]
MRREGRQDGMARTYVVVQDIVLVVPYYRSTCRAMNKFDPPMTTGNFMKVSSKPTNHSKRAGYRYHPIYKSKDKAKGSHKERYYDLLSSITWNRVGLNYAGSLATTILDPLANRHDHWADNYDEEVEYDLDDVYNRSHYLEEIDHEAGNEAGEDNDDDDMMSFCEVGFTLELLDGGWCAVRDI